LCVSRLSLKNKQGGGRGGEEGLALRSSVSRMAEDSSVWWCI
jgi:hypothetical protein